MGVNAERGMKEKDCLAADDGSQRFLFPGEAGLSFHEAGLSDESRPNADYRA